MSASWSMVDGPPLLLLCFVEIEFSGYNVHRIGVRGYGYIHGYPRKNLWIWIWIWMGNFISTASLGIHQNAPFWEEVMKNFLPRLHPRQGGGNPLPTPYPPLRFNSSIYSPQIDTPTFWSKVTPLKTTISHWCCWSWITRACKLGDNNTWQVSCGVIETKNMWWG